MNTGLALFDSMVKPLLVLTLVCIVIIMFGSVMNILDLDYGSRLVKFGLGSLCFIVAFMIIFIIIDVIMEN